jgi:hypothetical protein
LSTLVELHRPSLMFWFARFLWYHLQPSSTWPDLLIRALPSISIIRRDRSIRGFPFLMRSCPSIGCHSHSWNGGREGWVLAEGAILSSSSNKPIDIM